MSQKTVRVMEIRAMVDESALRKTLAQIEQLRASPETAGLDLCYGAVITLEITPERVESEEPMIHRYRMCAGAWTADVSPRAVQQGELQA